MNVFKARSILGLPDNWTDDELKKNYRTMAMKFHPDKCKTSDSSKFVEIQQAYEYLNGTSGMDHSGMDDILNTLFKSFTSFKVPNFKMKTQIKEIKITPKEYFTGTTRVLKVPVDCECERGLCVKCAGCGFGNILIMETCMECVGNGTLKTCNCNLYNTINIVIQAYANLNINKDFKIKIDDPRYVFINNKMYCTFDITLKESLVGFTKTFKDPFGELHDVTVKNTIIKQNDGFTLKISNFDLILLFNVIYPDVLKKSTKKIIAGLDF
jgi:DnaJ-class molecular chaperone